MRPKLKIVMLKKKNKNSYELKYISMIFNSYYLFKFNINLFYFFNLYILYIIIFIFTYFIIYIFVLFLSLREYCSILFKS